MNKYEKCMVSTRPKINPIARASHGGWGTPVCGDCALQMIMEIGRCDHVEYLRTEFIPERCDIGYRAFYSLHGTGLIATRGEPECGHS